MGVKRNSFSINKNCILFYVQKWGINYCRLQNQKTPQKKTEPCKDADDKINHSKINYLFPLNSTISCITEFQNIHSLQIPASHNDQQELISRLMVQRLEHATYTCMLQRYSKMAVRRESLISALGLAYFSGKRRYLHSASYGRCHTESWVTLHHISRMFSLTEWHLGSFPVNNSPNLALPPVQVLFIQHENHYWFLIIPFH